MNRIGIAVSATMLISLLLFAISGSGTNHTKQDYLQLVENKADITSGYTWYRMCNPTSVPFSISDSSKLNVSFIEVKNRLNSYRYTKLTNVSHQITKYDNFCSTNTLEYPATNITPAHNDTVTSCILKANGTTTGYRLEWVNWNPIGDSIPANTCYDVKVEGNYPAVLGGTAIDNIVSFAGFTYDEYAWWNTSWNNRCQINLTVTGDILHQNDEDNPWDYIEVRALTQCNFTASGDLKDVRIIRDDNGSMTSLARDNYKNQSIIFMLNSSINGTTDSNYYLYFNNTNSSLTEPSQTDYVILSGAGNISVRNRIYNITNCVISTCINGNGDNADRCYGYNVGAFSTTGENNFACSGAAFNGGPVECTIKYDGSVMAEILCENQVDSRKSYNLFKIYANSFVNITSSVGTESNQGSVRDAFDGTTSIRIYDGKIDRDIIADPNTNFDSDAYGNGTGVFINTGSWSKDIMVREWYVPQNNNYTVSVRSTYNANGFMEAHAINTNGPSSNFSRWFGMVTNKSTDPIWYFRGDYIVKGLRTPLTYRLGISEISTNTVANENQGDTAVESGVTSSVISNATILSNLQVYLRTLNNTQMLGRFDKVAISGNQRWAFNYVTASDSTSGFTNMVNITPSFYVLELTNRTSSNITSEVRSLINITKQ